MHEWLGTTLFDADILVGLSLSLKFHDFVLNTELKLTVSNFAQQKQRRETTKTEAQFLTDSTDRAR